MAQPIQKAPKFAQLKMPLSDADAYQYLESDKAGAVRLLQIGASWAGKKHLHCEPQRTSQPHC